MKSVIHTASTLKETLNRKARQRRSAHIDAVDVVRNRPSTRNDLLPKLIIEEVPLTKLLPPARNVRAVDAAHVRAVAASIATLGFSAPVLIDQNRRVLDGWIRIEAARFLGLANVPCVIADHLTPSERKLLRVALNRLGEKGSWDLKELRLELEELRLEEAPLEIAGFSGVELDSILVQETPTNVEEGELEPDESSEPLARLGDIFALGEHKIACGDARDSQLLARLMDGALARLVLTDVPYNVPIRGHVTGQGHREFMMASGEMSPDEFQAFNTAWIQNAMVHLLEGGALGTFIDWRGYYTVHSAATAAGLETLNLVVWSKTNAGMGSLYRSAHELLPLFKKEGAAHVNNVELGRHGRWRSNVWVYPGASSLGSDARKGLKEHPTVKPTAMLEDALYDLTNRGDIVIDPFLGSGSTLIAAEAAGRVCRGVELDPLYVDVALRRYEQVTGVRGVLIGNDESADGRPE